MQRIFYLAARLPHPLFIKCNTYLTRIFVVTYSEVTPPSDHPESPQEPDCCGRGYGALRVSHHQRRSASPTVAQTLPCQRIVPRR